MKEGSGVAHCRMQSMMHAKLQCYPPGGFYRSAIVYHVLQGVCHCLYYIAGTSIYCKELVHIAQHSLRHLDTIWPTTVCGVENMLSGR